MTDKPQDKKPNLWQRICAVRADVKAVAKDQTIGEGGWAYDVTSHEVINAELRPLMAKHGLVDYLGKHNVDVVDTGIKYGKPEKARPLLQHRGEYEYIVVNCDDPEDRLVIPVTGWGEDAGDKGPGKSSTYAFKEARKKLFSISSGDEDETRIRDENIRQPETETLSPAQIDKVLVEATNLFDENADDVVDRMLEKVFNVSIVAEIPAEHFEQAMNLLRNQHKREQEVSQQEEREPGSDDEYKIKPQAE